MVGDCLPEHHEYLRTGPRHRAADGGAAHGCRAGRLRQQLRVVLDRLVMQRHRSIPRPRWREKVEEIGLTYHSHEDGPYWDESAAYELSAKEVNALEAAANALHYLCIEAAEAVIKNEWWPRLGIPELAIRSILGAWERD